jgi:hypothetical protein
MLGFYAIVVGNCSLFEPREKILGPKWDTLVKHSGWRKSKKDIPSKQVKKGQKYLASGCQYLVNERRFAARQFQKPILQQLQEMKGERSRKKQQMGIIFYLLQHRRPMLEYEAIKPLLQFLECPKIPLRHWSDNSGWTLAGHMERYCSLSRLIFSFSC